MSAGYLLKLQCPEWRNADYPVIQGDWLHDERYFSVNGGNQLACLDNLPILSPVLYNYLNEYIFPDGKLQEFTMRVPQFRIPRGRRQFYVHTDIIDKLNDTSQRLGKDAV